MAAKIAVDPFVGSVLVCPMLADDLNRKLNACVNNLLKVWRDGKDEKLTQLLFCDLSTPKNDGTFNVHDADTEAKK